MNSQHKTSVMLLSLSFLVIAMGTAKAQKPWQPEGFFDSVWAINRGPAHMEFLKNDYERQQPVDSDVAPYKPQIFKAVWAINRGPAHLEFLKNEYERQKPAGSDVAPYKPQKFEAIWAINRGPAHLDFLRSEYESLN